MATTTLSLSLSGGKRGWKMVSASVKANIFIYRHSFCHETSHLSWGHQRSGPPTTEGNLKVLFASLLRQILNKPCFLFSCSIHSPLVLHSQSDLPCIVEGNNKGKRPENNGMKTPWPKVSPNPEASNLWDIKPINFQRLVFSSLYNSAHQSLLGAGGKGLREEAISV